MAGDGPRIGGVDRTVLGALPAGESRGQGVHLGRLEGWLGLRNRTAGLDPLKVEVQRLMEGMVVVRLVRPARPVSVVRMRVIRMGQRHLVDVVRMVVVKEMRREQQAAGERQEQDQARPRRIFAYDSLLRHGREM